MVRPTTLLQAAKAASSLPSVHCLLTTGLEESTEWKVSKTSWRFSPWHPDNLHTVGTFMQKPPLGTGLLTGAHSRGQPLLSAAPECPAWQVPMAGWGGRCQSCSNSFSVGECSFSLTTPYNSWSPLPSAQNGRRGRERALEWESEL